MGARITSRFPQDVDLVALAEGLRQADIEELQAVTDLLPCEAVIASVQASDPQFLRAWHADGQLVCIAGCSPKSHTVAAPWLLATDLLDLHFKSLHRYALLGLVDMLEVYPVLSNVVDVRQTRVVDWLLRLGFSVEIEPEFRKAGFGVVRFEMRAADV